MRKKLLLFSISTTMCCIQVLNAQNPIDAYLNGKPTYVTIGTSADGLVNPRDLDFKPGTKDEVWVINGQGSTQGGSTVTYLHANESSRTSSYRRDSNRDHFLQNASAIAFGEADPKFPTLDPNAEAGTNILWANTTEGNNGNNFMGPSLWPSDLTIYAKINQNNNLLGSHCDMLHQAPYSMGIAHETKNAYWTFDGQAGNICRVDFVVPHKYGGDDHSDGRLQRHVDVKVKRVVGIPSHMILDKKTNWLYICDTGNKRVIRANIKSGTNSGKLNATNEPLAEYSKITGTIQETISTDLTSPCGIDFYEGRLLVSDYSNGDIIVYDVTVTPAVVKGRIKTGESGIMGIVVDPNQKIWFVNNKSKKLIRIEPDPTVTSVKDHNLASNISLYPNPSTNGFKIDYTLNKTEKITINVLDTQGRLIDVLSVNGTLGNNVIQMDQKYPAGTYLIKMTVGNESHFKKVSIL
ncbi:MAG: T9SS type A sorting domain-containing protein [Bacteroidia bacterium]